MTTRLPKLDGAKPTTSSPGLKPVQSLPTREMTPANSKPSVGPAKPFSIASSDSRPSAYMTSRKLSPLACTSTST
ncbi:MAG: hypothetical protein AW07_04515 [Candidatus Accumulibacter sp. SK-11]|nr:MAG: hypothetical protein AW07_04515 [Candidatus Accumulibacter sp. SK-11]